ncbi:hypothetical protein FALBO_15099 [Fusarium albosuccineum]|uniref:NmrA-like domain-containing protein n=1 Tax=Fusarium albosuccineum TaxID=1237068 RepID=A0A8H4P0G2_9HYPO|nr:hypothetical protein FALBO_15099 [Fusarium albosuccineum]
MLVLIAGITGSLGQRLATAAQARGLKVRGLGRSPDKLDPSISQNLESFVKSTSHEDIPALDKAVAGVDAVICAYAPIDVLTLDGCLLLLRAAERANIKIFIASSWNNDWSKIKFGDLEHYDTHISFENHAALTSSIRPVYMFSGVFENFLLRFLGLGSFTMKDDKAVFRYWGDGHKHKQPWVTQDDAAAWTIEALLNGDGVRDRKGGFFRIPSGQNSIEGIAEAFGRVSGKPVELKRAGGIQELEDQVAVLRREKGRGDVWSYLPFVAELLANKGAWEMDDADILKLGHVKKPSTLEEALEQSIKTLPK